MSKKMEDWEDAPGEVEREVAATLRSSVVPTGCEDVLLKAFSKRPAQLLPRPASNPLRRGETSARAELGLFASNADTGPTSPRLDEQYLYSVFLTVRDSDGVVNCCVLSSQTNDIERTSTHSELLCSLT